MFKNYLKTALRTLSRNKLYTSLNIAGLTFGISCFLLIGLYLFDELTFDSQHKEADRIYRAIQHRKTPTEDLTMAAASYKVAEESKKSIPEIEDVARIVRSGRANLTNPDNNKTFQETVTIGSAGFMQIFNFQVVEGDLSKALKEPNTIIIAEELAKRYFNSTNVIGKNMVFEFINDRPLKVTAVIKNHPRNSSFDFSSMLSEATFSSDPNFEQSNSDWTAPNYMTFFLLKENANPQLVSKKVTDLLNANATWEAGNSMRFSLQPLKDMHLHSDGIVDAARNSNVDPMSAGVMLYLKIFAVVALFVLIIACINYMNLTTARASNRSKEIGVRKATGAHRSHLIYQFLTESILVTIISFILAVVVVNIILPGFNKFTNKELSLGFNTDSRLWLYSILAVTVTGLLAGSYPALLLSGFKPQLLLKTFKIQNKGDLSLRKSLVVFQFAISIVMIIATIVLFQQVQYVNNKNLGFNKELLLVVDINSGRVRAGAETITTGFSQIPNVKNVSVTSRVPGEWKIIPTIKIRPEGSTGNHDVSYLLGVDENFHKTFEVEVLKGRNFSGIGDSSAIILNETAARLLKITEPSGQILEIPSLAFGGNYFPLQDSTVFKPKVIGIVKDFHFQSLREKIAPMVLAYRHNPVHVIDYFTAKVEPTDIPGTLQKMDEVLKKVDATHTLEYHFLDEQLERFYTEDRRRQTILIWIAIATVFIACLGLFGLATYAADLRVKEIGIRKVLGASAMNLAALLSKDFLKLVFIAALIAFPIAWWATNKWLQEFAYHIEVAWWIFAAAGIAAIAIALLTVSYQAIKAALMNPVNSLRTE